MGGTIIPIPKTLCYSSRSKLTYFGVAVIILFILALKISLPNALLMLVMRDKIHSPSSKQNYSVKQILRILASVTVFSV